MFTGIIEETGTIIAINRGNKSASIRVSANQILEDVKTGDSINTNGVCLTVTSFDSDSFTIDVMSETMLRTNLINLKTGSKVNLERALKLNGRLGGHLVSGHIDGTGVISNLRKEENATWITISADSNILKYIIFKGSVAIDGISLTVANIAHNSFEVSIIPHTAYETTLSKKNIGDVVNLECDLIGKYIERMISNKNESNSDSHINMDFLKENGFL